MSAIPKIEVLLATYNGERFLREQIDSILAQDYENLSVLARDDGSTDSTRDILYAYEQQFPTRFRVMPESHATGNPKDNFLTLMKASRADYVCFSDQDDVWLPGKIDKTKSLMKHLEAHWGTDVPLLVFSDLRVVDDKLTVLYRSFWAHMNIVPERIDRLSELLGKSVVTGCTAMVNRRLLELSLRMPKEAAMHDRWIALLACALGKSAFLREQVVLYRQHDRNVLGIGENRTEPDKKRSLLARARLFRQNRERFVAEWNICQQQAEALLHVHGAELAPSKLKLLRAYRRCETSKNPIVRVAIWIGYRFFAVGFPANLATFLYLSRRKRST